jgi:hypothetical protein
MHSTMTQIGVGRDCHVLQGSGLALADRGGAPPAWPERCTIYSSRILLLPSCEPAAADVCVEGLEYWFGPREDDDGGRSRLSGGLCVNYTTSYRFDKSSPFFQAAR